MDHVCMTEDYVLINVDCAGKAYARPDWKFKSPNSI